MIFHMANKWTLCALLLGALLCLLPPAISFSEFLPENRVAKAIAKLGPHPTQEQIDDLVKSFEKDAAPETPSDQGPGPKVNIIRTGGKNGGNFFGIAGRVVGDGNLNIIAKDGKFIRLDL